MQKVLILGSTGFVGKNIIELFKSQQDLMTFGTSRDLNAISDRVIYFDIENQDTWENIIQIKPDVIINSSGYGVVKEEKELEKMYNINYLKIQQLIRFIEAKASDVFWLQIGTAFEYDLEAEKIDEQTPCIPLSHYGISKFLLSHWLLNKAKLRFSIIRPFAMFGAGESESKIIPLLINAQLRKETIKLSSGEQVRDYFFVGDLAAFLLKLTTQKENTPSVMSVGSNQPISLLELAHKLSAQIKEFDAQYWGWNAIAQRQDESKAFYNGSDIAFHYGMNITPLEEALKRTYIFYKNNLTY